MARPDPFSLQDSPWFHVLHHVSDGVLVLDRDRNLAFANPAARALLGYDEGDHIGGRCKQTTRGDDCEHACPLTFALSARLDAVEGFSTVYRSRDGQPVPLRVTVIPLRGADGELLGAVEVLRPGRPDPGFFLAPTSPRLAALRRQVEELAVGGEDVWLVGDSMAAADVADAIHRLSGLDPSLLRVVGPSREPIPSWPPGTLVATAVELAELGGSVPPPGWRLIVLADHEDDAKRADLAAAVVRLPSLAEVAEDVPLMLASWARRLRPGVVLAPEVLERLTRMGLDRGLAPVRQALVAAVAAADGRVEVAHLPTDCNGSPLVDEVLRQPNPLAAVEACLLREVLGRCGWRMQEAADRLGISRVTLWRKLKDHGIDRDAEA